MRLSRPAFGPVTVDYATSDGTATAGADYTATSGTLTFSATEQTKTVSVRILDDSHEDDGETFTLTLSSPRTVTLRTGPQPGRSRTRTRCREWEHCLPLPSPAPRRKIRLEIRPPLSLLDEGRVKATERPLRASQPERPDSLADPL